MLRSVKKMLEHYKQTKTSRVSQMEAAARGGETPLSDAIDAEGLAIDAWSPEDARRVVAEFGGYAARAAVKWRAGPLDVSSPPTIFGPLSEEEVGPTCQLAFRAHLRSIEECDEDDEEECGFADCASGCGARGAPVRADDWKRVVHGWISQAIRLEDRDELAGSILDELLGP